MTIPLEYLTPVFDESDPIISREMQLRPSLWAVVFAHLEQLSQDWSWRKSENVGSATVQQVIDEMTIARTALEADVMGYIGEIKEFATENPPEGWLRCTGATYANVDYPLLAAVIHPSFVVDVDHFRVPDRDRRIGMDGLLVGDHEGEETHTLTFAEVPAEVPNIPFDFIELQAGVGGFALFDIDAYGGGNPHNNIQPVEGTQFFIRAAWPTGA